MVHVLLATNKSLDGTPKKTAGMQPSDRCQHEINDFENF